MCIDKLHDTLTQVDTLIVSDRFSIEPSKGAVSLVVAHIVGRQFVFRLRLLEVGEADFIFCLEIACREREPLLFTCASASNGFVPAFGAGLAVVLFGRMGLQGVEDESRISVSASCSPSSIRKA